MFKHLIKFVFGEKCKNCVGLGFISVPFAHDGIMFILVNDYVCPICMGKGRVK